MKLVAASILAADFTKLGKQVLAAAEGGADWVHIDVMDGSFVPNISIGVPVVQSLSKIDCPPMDIHLMIDHPERIIGAFAGAGGSRANNITVQIEACSDIYGVLDEIRAAGLMAGVAFNPSTPLSDVEKTLQSADIALVMSVEPGFSGQAFIESSLEKIRQLRSILGPPAEGTPLIEVDGGIDIQRAALVFGAGADVVVSGSALFGKDDICGAVKKMKIVAGAAV